MICVCLNHGVANASRYFAPFIGALDQFSRGWSRVAVRRGSTSRRLGRDGRGEERFTSSEMIAVEEQLHRAAQLMADYERHGVHELGTERALAQPEERGFFLSEEQHAAFAHVT
jgi:hypothetical protein